MIADITNTLFSITDRIGAARALGLSRQALLRALMFEVTSNLDLLALVDPASLKNAAVDAPAFTALLGGLETGAAFSVLFSDDSASRELYGFLAAAGELEETAEVENAQAARVQKSVLAALLFVVRKITVLRKAAALAPGAFAKTPRLAVRVGNIKAHLDFIQSKLRELDAAEPFLIR